MMMAIGLVLFFGAAFAYQLTGKKANHPLFWPMAACSFAGLGLICASVLTWIWRVMP